MKGGGGGKDPALLEMFSDAPLHSVPQAVSSYDGKRERRSGELRSPLSATKEKRSQSDYACARKRTTKRTGTIHQPMRLMRPRRTQLLHARGSEEDAKMTPPFVVVSRRHKE